MRNTWLLEKGKNESNNGEEETHCQRSGSGNVRIGVTYAPGPRRSFSDDVGLVVEACGDGATGLGGEG